MWLPSLFAIHKPTQIIKAYYLMRLSPLFLNTLILKMKIKPYYILLKWNMKHPENRNRTNLYEIWKEYDDGFTFDSILYSEIEFHDSLSEAREHKRRLLNG